MRFRNCGNYVVETQFLYQGYTFNAKSSKKNIVVGYDIQLVFYTEIKNYQNGIMSRLLKKIDFQIVLTKIYSES